VAISGDHRDAKPIGVLQPKLQYWKSYKRTDWKLITMWEPISGAIFCGINRKILRKSSNLEIMFSGFPREKKHIWANSRKDGLVHLVCWDDLQTTRCHMSSKCVI